MPGASSAEECSVSDMKKGKSYRYRVCAQNRQGKGPYMEFSEPVLAEDPPTVPDAVRNLNYSNVKKDSVCLNWSMPKTDGGAPITGAFVYISPCYGSKILNLMQKLFGKKCFLYRLCC